MHFSPSHDAHWSSIEERKTARSARFSAHHYVVIPSDFSWLWAISSKQAGFRKIFFSHFAALFFNGSFVSVLLTACDVIKRTHFGIVFLLLASDVINHRGGRWHHWLAAEQTSNISLEQFYPNLEIYPTILYFKIALPAVMVKCCERKSQQYLVLSECVFQKRAHWATSCRHVSMS